MPYESDQIIALVNHAAVRPHDGELSRHGFHALRVICAVITLRRWNEAFRWMIGKYKKKDSVGKAAFQGDDRLHRQTDNLKFCEPVKNTTGGGGNAVPVAFSIHVSGLNLPPRLDAPPHFSQSFRHAAVILNRHSEEQAAWKILT